MVGLSRAVNGTSFILATHQLPGQRAHKGRSGLCTHSTAMRRAGEKGMPGTGWSLLFLCPCLLLCGARWLKTWMNLLAVLE